MGQYIYCTWYDTPRKRIKLCWPSKFHEEKEIDLLLKSPIPSIEVLNSKEL